MSYTLNVSAVANSGSHSPYSDIHESDSSVAYSNSEITDTRSLKYATFSLGSCSDDLPITVDDGADLSVMGRNLADAFITAFRDDFSSGIPRC